MKPPRKSDGKAIRVTSSDVRTEVVSLEKRLLSDGNFRSRGTGWVRLHESWVGDRCRLAPEEVRERAVKQKLQEGLNRSRRSNA